MVSSPFLVAIDLTGRGGAILCTALPLTALGARGLKVVGADVVAVVDGHVDRTVAGGAARPTQLPLPLVEHVVSSASELILRCDPVQPLPHDEIFTEQLILS